MRRMHFNIPDLESIPPGSDWGLGFASDESKFPETVGALFFGMSLVLFYLTARDVFFKISCLRYKLFAFAGIALIFVLGCIAHGADFVQVLLLTNFTRPADGSIPIGYVEMTVHHRLALARKLTISSLLITSWVAGGLLIWRAFILSRHAVATLLALGTLLLTTIVAEVVSLAMGSRFASPAFPAFNLLLSICVTILVIYYTIAGAELPKSPIRILSLIMDIFADSGVPLTIALVILLALSNKDYNDVKYPLYDLLPHVQNIVSCILFSRVISSYEDGPGPIMLPTDRNEDY